MKSFRMWLKQFIGRDQEFYQSKDFRKLRFCDLASDAFSGRCDISEKDGHKQLGCFSFENTYESWESHLRLHMASSNAIETLQDAWFDYSEEVWDNKIWKIEYSELAEEYGQFPWHHDLASRRHPDNEWANSWGTVFLGTHEETHRKLKELIDEWERNQANWEEKNNSSISYVVSPKQRERRKMTKKLRYEIIKRDGYRCVVCGRSADDGIKLHVDHIVAVSKGGKTHENNLRTLCIECNLGKSVGDA